MLKTVLACSLAIAVAGLSGCKDDQSKDTAAPSGGTMGSSGAAPAMPAMPAAPSTQPSTPETTVPSIPSTSAPAIPPLPAIPSTSAPGGTSSSATPATPGATAADPEAQSLMSKLEQEVKNQKWDDADADLKKLQAMKDKLPESMQKQLDTMQAAIMTGKGSGGVTLPGLPESGNK